MKFSARIFLAFFLLLSLVAYALLTNVFNELKPGFSRATEETLVDTANLLAEVLASDMAADGEPSDEFARALDNYAGRRLDAQIYELSKTEPALRVYVTDAQGKVVFDSTGKDIGEDYSRWNDVLRTLRGEYGARATRDDPDDEFSTVYYVAAPIHRPGHRQGSRPGELLGVVSVGKPSRTLLPYLEAAEFRIGATAILLVLGGVLIGGLFAAWISRSLRRLSDYAEAVSRGEPARLPTLKEPEFASLGEAMARMREKLEGKEYVEDTVHALTHELKSPLAAIRAAVELLAESPDAEDRDRFIANIRREGDRMQRIAERMLQLASVERQQELASSESVDVVDVVRKAMDARRDIAAARSLDMQLEATGGYAVRGDRFLLEQSVGNLLDNAIDFSPAGGKVLVALFEDSGKLNIEISDEGSGVPDYAIKRVFERFYSLPRQESGARSTGLGLSFVREVARLHGGSASLANRAAGGAVALLVLPRIN